MKNLSLFCLFFACIGLQSCKKEKPIEAPEKQDLSPVSTICYKSLYESDTVNLTLNTLKNGKITGEMVMKLENMPEKTGTVAGEFRGDTLFIDYSFIQGTNKNRTFKNPMAFLKKGDSLNLGSGKILTYLGKSYFDKETPIEFEKVKYKFSTVECESK
ncbi:hypothetical protein [Flavobacterium adhaerens]|uniref:hypothetical protein n=1 Tax=Flavobacterium adhaerens TaxID=3149043 RepID=UPI0032B347DA